MNNISRSASAVFYLVFIILIGQAPNILSQYNTDDYLFKFPASRIDRPAFRQQVIAWRNEMSKGYNGGIYADSNLQWTQGLYLVSYSNPWSSLIVDEDGKSQISIHPGFYNKRFGGIDLLWLRNGSPLLGIDMKNQWDFYRSYAPCDGESFKGLANILTEYRRLSGSRIAFSYSPLDNMTRRENVSDLDMLIRMFSETGMDAVNWDRLDDRYQPASDTIRKVKSDAVLIAGNPPALRDPEFIKQVSEVPVALFRTGEEDDWGLIIPRWFERRHCISIFDEGYSSANTILHGIQLGFLNGCGWLIEEEYNDRAPFLSNNDVSWIRLALPIFRRYRAFFTNQAQDGWIPCIDTEQDNIYGSLWQKDGIKIWTLVNHSEEEISDTIIKIQHFKGFKYYDLIKGIQVEPDTARKEIFLIGNLRSNGLACYLATNRPDSAFKAFLHGQEQTYVNSDWDTRSQPRTVHVKPVPLMARNELPQKMFSFTYSVTVDLPSFSYLDLNGSGGGAGEMQVTLQPYAIDIEPVTNRDWQQFINESGYVPDNTDRYLQHWQGGYRGQPEPGKEDHPVVWISLKDAMTYARYYNKRLPTHYEYQYAEMKGVIRNGQYHYWNMTGDVFSNMFSKWVCLKGGTEFSKTDNQEGPAIASAIYAPDAGNPGLAVNKSGILDIYDPAMAWELFLGPPAMQRSGTVGFRCAVDLR